MQPYTLAMILDGLTRRLAALFIALSILALGLPAQAQSTTLGYRQLPQPGGGGVVTVFYPSTDPEAPSVQGPFTLSWAANGAVANGNGHLVVISHGSGGSPWVHVDLARALVQRGFTVALPQHAGDNYLDPSEPGPASWIKRPTEVSGAIDALAARLRDGAAGTRAGKSVKA